MLVYVVILFVIFCNTETSLIEDLIRLIIDVKVLRERMPFFTATIIRSTKAKTLHKPKFEELGSLSYILNTKINGSVHISNNQFIVSINHLLKGLRCYFIKNNKHVVTDF